MNTLIAILLAWYPASIPVGSMKIMRIDGFRLVAKVEKRLLRFECIPMEDAELPAWTIDDRGNEHTIIPRKAFPLGWCNGWKHEFLKLDQSSVSIFVFQPSINLPPSLPGISGTFHYIRDDKGNCVGHFVQACEESEDQAWEWMQENPWSLLAQY